MKYELEFREALRYIFPENCVATAEIEYVERFEPTQVRYEPGAVGFEFIELAEHVSQDGEIAKFVRSTNQYYYWGQTIALEQLEDSPSYSMIVAQCEHEEFCLTSWGALIPLDEEDTVVPYPYAFELPADMRLDG